MTTPQRIEQLKQKGKERILREESRNSDVTRVGPLKSFIISEEEFDALLLQIQDEQKEICESNLDKSLHNPQHGHFDRLYMVRNAPLAYNPKEKV